MRIINYIFVFIIACSLSFSCSDKKKVPSKNSLPMQLDKSETEVEQKTSSKKIDKPSMTQEQLKKAGEIISKVTSDQIASVDVKSKYKMLCSSCHGFKGDLMINGAKDLSISKISLTEGVAQVYFGKGLMTPFKGLLKDFEIVAVVKYIENEIRKN